MTTATRTRKIAGHALLLAAGRRYLASRPMADGRTRFDVAITDITDGYRVRMAPVAVVPGLRYDEANRLLAAFNDGKMSFEGRIW